MAISMRLQKAKATARSVGILLVDLAADFYTTLPEVALGGLLTDAETTATLLSLGFSQRMLGVRGRAP
jgi:hypothetical protein